MSKKASLGHNPLAYSLKSHASFDFIRNTQNQDSADEEESVQIQKKVASYYLEEDVIKEIRTIADKEDKSYSCVANDFLKASIEKKQDEDLS